MKREYVIPVTYQVNGHRVPSLSLIKVTYRATYQPWDGEMASDAWRQAGVGTLFGGAAAVFDRSERVGMEYKDGNGPNGKHSNGMY